MMDKKVAAALVDDNGEFHSAILTTSLALLKTSKQMMGSYYPAWDLSDNNFRLKRMVDESDVSAARRKEPMKTTLPFAHPQVLTFVAFCMLLFTQRDYFFEIEGSGPEDEDSPGHSPERDAQDVLERDLRHNKFIAQLYQLLLDLGKFGIAVVKPSWDEKKVMATIQQSTQPGQTMAGQDVGSQMEEVEVEKTVYLGNRLDPISPYHWYPDTRIPMTRFQEGEFCADELEYSMERLGDWEADGLAVGLDKIRDLNSIKQEADIFYTNCRFGSVSPDMSQNMGDVKGTQGMAIITEMQRWITPDKFSEKHQGVGDLLGEGKRPQLYLIWIANWSRVIRFEKMEYLHKEFTYCAGQFSHDQHRVVNEGLAELLEPIETMATWFLNSRVASVRKNVDSKMFLDPQSVEWSDVVERKPVIRMKPTARGTVDQWFKQIQVTDVTQGHMQDIQVLWQFAQAASGISENMLGQYSAGRRDATQSKAVASGASGRMKMVASVVWEVLFSSMGQQMLTNLQDGLTIEEFRKIVGDDADDKRFADFNKRTEGVIGAYDFSIFDGTLPSEKGYQAQTMQELFLGMFSNPQAVMMLQTEPFRSLLVEIASLRSIRHPERFLPPVQQPTNVTNIQPNPGAGPTQPPQQAPGTPGQPVVSALPSAAGPAVS